jgi:hypothetical protein
MSWKLFLYCFYVYDYCHVVNLKIIAKVFFDTNSSVTNRNSNKNTIFLYIYYLYIHISFNSILLSYF